MTNNVFNLKIRFHPVTYMLRSSHITSQQWYQSPCLFHWRFLQCIPMCNFTSAAMKCAWRSIKIPYFVSQELAMELPKPTIPVTEQDNGVTHDASGWVTIYIYVEMNRLYHDHNPVYNDRYFIVCWRLHFLVVWRWWRHGWKTLNA